MNHPVKRLATVIVFSLLGLISLVIGDVVSQWLCARLFACGAAIECPIDVCEGDVHLTVLRLAVWIGPAVVFGISAFLFSGRRRSRYAWMGLLASLMVAHSLIMVASR